MALLKTVTLLAALAAAVHGFTVPKNQSDGVYIAYLDDDANEHHFALNITGANVVERDDLTKRFTFPSGSSPDCGGGSLVSLPLLDFMAAESQFKNACSAGTANIKQTQAVYGVSGDAVVYMCNYSKKGNPCSEDEYNEARSEFTQTCTQVPGVQAGWYSVPAWNKSYGWQFNGEDFC